MMLWNEGLIKDSSLSIQLCKISMTIVTEIKLIQNLNIKNSLLYNPLINCAL